MLGYRDSDWLVGLNPVFGWDLSDGLAEGKPDIAFGLKVARSVGGALRWVASTMRNWAS